MSHRRRASQDVGTLLNNSPHRRPLSEVLEEREEEEVEKQDADYQEDSFQNQSFQRFPTEQSHLNSVYPEESHSQYVHDSFPTSPSVSPGPSPTRMLPTPKFGKKNAEHSRQHSRIHERNLSVFFPHPGQERGVGYGDTYEDSNASHMGGVSDIPLASTSITNGWHPSEGDRAMSPENDSLSKSQRERRRGHHHRHSVSHNFFPFLDATEANSHSNEDPLQSFNRSQNSEPTSKSFSATSLSHEFSFYHRKYAHLPSPARFLIACTTVLDIKIQLGLLLSIAEVALGATLWIRGQAGESLSVTGLGYLVVFDGIGGLSGTLVEGGSEVADFWHVVGAGTGDSGIRLPYGTSRLVTLSHFSQAIYLLFSAVYVCKESVEHVLLLHGSMEGDGAHGTGHGGMGHGEGIASAGSALEHGIKLPVMLLGLSAFLSIASALALQNHQTLTDAVGNKGLSFSRPRHPNSQRGIVDLIGNPFSLTVIMFSLGLLASAYTVAGIQLAPLDKVLALLESIAMFYIAYPAAVATGQVLLQTSPPIEAAQTKAILSGLQDIKNHPLVESLKPPHIWQLTPHPGNPSDTSVRQPHATARDRDPSQAATIITTLVVSVKNDASDADLLQITKFARDRCAPALKWGTTSSSLVSNGRRRSVQGLGLAQGELTVSVVRAPKGASMKFYGSGDSTVGDSGYAGGSGIDIGQDVHGHKLQPHQARTHPDHGDHANHHHAQHSTGNSHSHSHAH